VISLTKLHEGPAARRISAAARATLGQKRVLFAALCFVWGTTWLAMKVGIATVPPGLFAGTRWTVAGLVLLLVRALTGHSLAVPFRLRARLVLCSILMVSVNQVIQLYGLRHITAGLAAVLNSALTPLGLLGFAVVLRQEPFRWRQLGAVALGVAGILLLFAPKALSGRLDIMEVWGALAVAISTLSYAAGSVLARPLMRTLPPVQAAAMTNFIGGSLLLLFALAFEPGALGAITGNWGWPAFLAWLYLLLPASLGATIIYFLLVRDWGASRTGMYGFISPIIAVGIGFAWFGERVETTEVFGMILMLLAAGMVLRSRR
jgi:drug/metabolite transporter (DMT)-like permease